MKQIYLNLKKKKCFLPPSFPNEYPISEAIEAAADLLFWGLFTRTAV